jgi:uncharacterized protein (TIGR03067 family)
MSDRDRNKLPRWLVITTGVAGLLGALLVVGTRYYEIRKAKLEAERAERTEPPAKDAPPQEPPPDQKTKVLDTLTAEERQVQGRWEVISSGRDIKTFPTPFPAAEAWVFQGKVLTIERKDGGKLSTIAGSYTLGKGDAPLHFDYEGPGWAKRAVSYHGVYELQGNQLTVCFVIQPPGTAKPWRAESFDTRPGSGRILLKFRRE